jgi:hypothetical protein
MKFSTPFVLNTPPNASKLAIILYRTRGERREPLPLFATSQLWVAADVRCMVHLYGVLESKKHVNALRDLLTPMPLYVCVTKVCLKTAVFHLFTYRAL